MHIGGSTYAENLLAFGSHEGLCINPKTMNTYKNAQCPYQNQLTTILTGNFLYNKIINAWSMRNFYSKRTIWP